MHALFSHHAHTLTACVLVHFAPVCSLMDLTSPTFIVIVILITVPVFVAFVFWLRFMFKSVSSTEKDEIRMEPTSAVEPTKISTRSISTVSSSGGTSLKEAVLENFRANRDTKKSTHKPSPKVALQIHTSDIDAYQV